MRSRTVVRRGVARRVSSVDWWVLALPLVAVAALAVRLWKAVRR